MEKSICQTIELHTGSQRNMEILLLYAKKKEIL